MQLRPQDILKLDEILKPCVELTSLSLALYIVNYNDALRHKLANDLSLLLGHHLTVKRLVLRNFNGYEDKYPLPTSLETLVLMGSFLTSSTPHIRDLTILNPCCHSQSDMEGCLKFVESQAETLVSLDIDFSKNGQQPTVDSLKRMAKCLAEFNELQRFKYKVQTVHDMLVILREVMPLIAINESLNSYTIISDHCFLGYDKDILQQLQLAMKTLCIGRRRLLDFALLICADHRGGSIAIPIVEYEDLWEVVGDRCRYPESYFSKTI